MVNESCLFFAGGSSACWLLRRFLQDSNIFLQLQTAPAGGSLTACQARRSLLISLFRSEKNPLRIPPVDCPVDNLWSMFYHMSMLKRIPSQRSQDCYFNLNPLCPRYVTECSAIRFLTGIHFYITWVSVEKLWIDITFLPWRFVFLFVCWDPVTQTPSVGAWLHKIIHREY